MFETLVPAVIAVATGVGVLSTQIHRRITQVDRRLDGVELKIAEKYVTRNELSLRHSNGLRITSFVLRTKWTLALKSNGISILGGTCLLGSSRPRIRTNRYVSTEG